MFVQHLSNAEIDIIDGTLEILNSRYDLQSKNMQKKKHR